MPTTLYTLRGGADAHPEDSVLQFFTDIVVAGGVLNLSADFKVTERGSGANMSVDVAAGRAYLKKNGNAYPVRSTDVENIAISNNVSGNPRIDSVVLYLDLAADPSIEGDGSGICILDVVEGSPAASPSAPDSTAISSAIGGSNPYIVVGDVRVENGTGDIVNADITDSRKRVFMRTPSAIYQIPYSSTITPDYRNGSQQKVALSGNITVNEPSNMEIGDVMIIDFIQDGTGNRTATFSFTTRASGGVDPSLGGVINTVTSIGIRKIAASTYHVQYVDVGAI